MRIKSWKARVIQSECLSKLVAPLKHDRIDDDAEDERNEEILCDCFFPQYIVSSGVSAMWRRTEGEVRRDSCDSVSFKTVRRRAVQTNSQGQRVTVANRAVSAVQGCLFSDAAQSHFKQGQFTRAGCWMMAGIERWEYEDEDDAFEFGHEVSAEVQ